MVHFTRWCYRTALCLLAFFSLSFVWYRSKRETSQAERKVPKMTKDSITPLNDQRTFILSAYYDNREKNIIRVIGIVHHQDVKLLYCWFHCRSRDGYTFIIKADLDLHADRFGFPYGTADILCPEPENCDPKYVSIHWSAEGDSDQLPAFELKNQYPEDFSANFTVCLPTLYGTFNNALQFIQTMEMYKLLGAQKVMLYKLHSDCCSQAIEQVLQYYTDEGTLEVIPWPIDLYFHVSTKWYYFPSDATNIGYFGQTAVLNDCLYRNMYRSKFVLLNDIDEIILPFKHQDWDSMMVSLQQQNPKACAFLFENHVFPSTELDPSSYMSSWNTTPGVNILQCIHRQPKGQNHVNRKMIVEPRKVIQVSVHNVLKASGASQEVSSDIAILRHCKKTPPPQLPKECLIRDTTIWRYKDPLTERVNNALFGVTKLQQCKGGG